MRRSRPPWSCMGLVSQWSSIDWKPSAAVPCFAVAFLTGSTPRSGARPDTHRDPRTSAPGLPNRDYTRGHVETPLRASWHNGLPIPPGRAGKYLTKNNFILFPEILEHVFHVVNQMRPACIRVELYPLIFYEAP